MEIVNPVTGIKMYYHFMGDLGKPVVVLMHGWTANHTRWAQVERRLAADFRVIAYDLRGHGWSEKGPELDYGFGSHVLDLQGLMSALKIERATLVGHSMGGMIAQHFALAFPDKVENLVLIGTCACTAPEESKRRAMRALSWMFLYMFEPVMAIKNRDKWTKLDLYPDMLDDSLKPSPEAAKEGIIAVANMDLRERLASLQTPALVIASEDDDTVPFELSCELAASLPKCVMARVSGCGHHIPIDMPDFVSEKVKEFAAENVRHRKAS